MPILAGDIKLLASAVMADVPEGGGAPTGTSIPDGASNTIFPDISELDRAAGRVSLRKVFPAVHSADTDTYYGANVIVADPPDDPRVSVTLFSTGKTFDTRAEAQSRMEAYLYKGPEISGILFGDHIAGQRVVQLFQRTSDIVPNVGQTLVIVQDEGLSTQKEQYVRIIDVSVVTRQFTDTTSGIVDYEAAVVSLSISDALRYDFKGSVANRYFRRDSGAAIVRDTVVADAGMYTGVVPLSQAASTGDYTVRVKSVYTQLVPSAQIETPITATAPYTARSMPMPGSGPMTYTYSNTWSPTVKLSLPTACLPGSLTITTGGLTITDSAGILKTSSGDIGTIDYANGVLTLNADTLSATKTITYTPAAYILRQPDSSEIPVTLESRSQSYVGFVDSAVLPGTLTISYMVQGRWYVLSEQGNGVIKGLDASYGAGTYNRDTGSFVVTLGALPDVGSSIIVTWGMPSQETRHAYAELRAAQKIQLTPPEGEGADTQSVVVRWVHGGVNKLAAVAANGLLSGDATGHFDSLSHVLTFEPTVMPEVGTLLTVDYVTGTKYSDSPYFMRRTDGKVEINIGSALVRGSIAFQWYTMYTVYDQYGVDQLNQMGVPTTTYYYHSAKDDANGNIILSGTNQIIGSVDYNSGTIVFNPDVQVRVKRYRVYVWPGVSSTNTSETHLITSGVEYVDALSLFSDQYGSLWYSTVTATNSKTETFSFAPGITLVPGVSAQVVPGSVALSVQGLQPWGDDGRGNLREYTSSGWLTRGTINYLTGEVTMTSWPAGMTNLIERYSCVTTAGTPISNEYVFRTSVAPLRPGSLSIQYARATGGTQTVTANLAGEIAATGVIGSVDYQTGIVRLRFGEYVTAAGNESEPWYLASAVRTDGTIFKPAPVAISTVRYTAVAYSYLPIDADLLGLDPVRLPSDGRVPIFRPGSFAVVGHTGSVTATVSNGQTLNLGRVRLSRVRVLGHDGVVISNGYAVDLEAGTITFADVSGYSQPVTIEHRVEDMAMVRDVQISGEITFTRPVTHDYPLGSYVSSALVMGDMAARVSLVFDQSTWTGVWDDTVIGSSATATYNHALYPITVADRGALTERWAIRFTNTTSFEVIGEHVGIIAIGSTTTDCAPINPITNEPYFHIPALGWGSGWAAGNVLRINTVGAMYPVWVVRTVQQGPATVLDDAFTLLIRGDVDTP